MTDQPVSVVLNRAADLIEERGWMQDYLGPVEGPYCTIGAIRRAGGVPENTEWPEGSPTGRAYYAVRDHIGTFIADWNDAPERTAAEVIEVLRAAAVIAEARENAAVEVSA